MKFVWSHQIFRLLLDISILICRNQLWTVLDGSYNLRGLEKGTQPHLYSFQREVQPVFTAKCVACHDYGKKAGEKLNLSGDRGAYFATSYVDLWALGVVKCVGGGPAEIQPAYSWGAHASKLTKKLYGHAGVALTDD